VTLTFFPAITTMTGRAWGELFAEVAVIVALPLAAVTVKPGAPETFHVQPAGLAVTVTVAEPPAAGIMMPFGVTLVLVQLPGGSCLIVTIWPATVTAPDLCIGPPYTGAEITRLPEPLPELGWIESQFGVDTLQGQPFGAVTEIVAEPPVYGIGSAGPAT
jgi:hypothetical protein